MKKLIILRGIPAIGKSTWVEKNGLSLNTVSLDALRILYTGMAVENDKICTNNDHNYFIFKKAAEIIESRLINGLLTVVDATHAKFADIKQYDELCLKYGYELIVIDFPNDINQAMENNLKRESYKFVKEESILRMSNLIDSNKMYLKDYRVLSHEVKIIDELAKEIYTDVSKYKQVVFIGDTQGTSNPLENYFKDYPMRDDYLYVLVGDYIDRGKDNDKSLDFCLKNFKKENFEFFFGNHEIHLKNWVDGLVVTSEEFVNNTLPQIEMMDKKEILKFTKSLRVYGVFVNGETKIQVSHCGFFKFLEAKDYVDLSHNAFVKQRGYASKVDESFNLNRKDNEYQVHGHRNPSDLPLDNNTFSFPLEERVEFGGFLRIACYNTETNEFTFLRYQ